MDKYCKDQIKCNEDTVNTWTCAAQLDSGRAFQCPYSPDEIKIIGDREVMEHNNGARCEDWRRP